MTKDDVVKVWEFLGMEAENFVNNSGLKEEYRGICFAGYCCAMNHLAYALNLPVEMEDFDAESPMPRKIRAAFPE